MTTPKGSRHFAIFVMTQIKKKKKEWKSCNSLRTEIIGVGSCTKCKETA